MPVSDATSPEQAAMTAATPSSTYGRLLQERQDRITEWHRQLVKDEFLDRLEQLVELRLERTRLPVDLVAYIAVLNQALTAVSDGVQNTAYLDVVDLLQRPRAGPRRQR